MFNLVQSYGLRAYWPLWAYRTGIGHSRRSNSTGSINVGTPVPAIYPELPPASIMEQKIPARYDVGNSWRLQWLMNG
jgi:hypothetical protein